MADPINTFCEGGCACGAVRYDGVGDARDEVVVELGSSRKGDVLVVHAEVLHALGFSGFVVLVAGP